MTGRDGKRATIWDRGPKWITAIAGLIVALFGAGVVGRATAPSPSTTVNQPGSPSGQVGGPAVDQPKPDQGTVLAACPSVDVSDGYGISFGAECPHPVETNMYTADLVYRSNLSSSGKLAILNTPTISYTNCKNDTRYTDYLSVELGEVVCFTGHGVIAAVKVTNQGTNPSFVSFDVTVWQGP